MKFFRVFFHGRLANHGKTRPNSFGPTMRANQEIDHSFHFFIFQPLQKLQFDRWLQIFMNFLKYVPISPISMFLNRLEFVTPVKFVKIGLKTFH